MSLGVVSPIRNKGLYSDWLSAAPLATSMLTIDTSGNVGSQSIPVAAWGSITGTLSNQTDLHNALNAKLSLTGGTVTGQLTNALGTITASTPLTLTQTWNNAATTFTGILANVTDTASASGSLLMDLQVGGSSRFKVGKDGHIYGGSTVVGISNSIVLNAASTYAMIYSANVAISDNGSFRNVWIRPSTFGTGEFLFAGGMLLGWSDSNGNAATTTDLVIRRDAANTLAQRNSTNAQTFRVYNTYTDASNYERGKIEWSSNVLRIGTEKAGTGSARALELQTGGTTRLTVDTGGNTTINTDVSTGSTPLTLKYNSTTMFSFNYTGTFNCGLTGNEGLINLNSGYGYITTVGSSATTRHLQLRSFNGINLDIGGLGGSGLKLLTFGGVTSSFPALKRSTTNIEVRLADDSGFATIKGKLATDTNYTAGAPTATGYIVLYDAAGTAYKIPAEAL